MTQFSVILPAAGSSTRFQGFQTKKPFIDLAGIPVWRRTVDAFADRSDVCQIQLVLAKPDVSAFTERFGELTDDIQIVVGGASRAASVRNALSFVDPSADCIAVHDAARPLVSSAVIDSVFQMAEEAGAAIPGIPVNSTVKQIGTTGHIHATIDRSQLRLAQTPQTFNRNVLIDAYDKVADRLPEFTDEASVVEAAGHAVKVTEGSWDNIKITTAHDYHLAQLILSSRGIQRRNENNH
jgi:2-C-methyl-D-erythritol 4-phosphate cytidylyltransferase